MASRLRTNRVCFTINNYELEDADNFVDWFSKDENIQYGIVGQEVGASGTPHLQGMVHYNIDRKKAGINFWKGIIPGGARAHIEAARGSDEDSKKYCSKDGIYLETGECKAPGNKWLDIFEAAKTDLPNALSIDPEISIRHYNQLKAIHLDHNKPKMQCNLKDLREWQDEAWKKLMNQSDRQILFVVDEEGGKGKSALAKHILTTTKSWACQGGKIGDLMHSYDTMVDYVVFDMARCNNPDYFPWNFMENLKNGWFTSTKYNGGMKIFNPPKIVVFMNEMPPRNKLSSDRYEIYKI
jgi:hypothetical protein